MKSTNALLARLESSFEREKRFASDAAHELRTPISALKVHLHNLINSDPDDTIKQHQKSLEELKDSADRMGHLTEQILTLNRTTPEQFFSHLEPLDLYTLVQNEIVNIYPQAEEARLKLELSGSSTTINGDRFALETLLRNLLGNACKYTPAGGSVTASIEQSADLVTLQIEDSGPGVPEDQYDRLFDRFYRLDGDRHSSGKPGCGLGLAIVKHITDLHRASIELSHSSHETGLCVTIRFPSNPTQSTTDEQDE